METLELLNEVSATAPIFVPYFDANHRDDYLKLASILRTAGLGVEVYPEPKKLGAQLKYADQKGFVAAIIAGETEWQEGRVQIKTLANKQSEDVQYTHADASGVVDALTKLLNS